MDSQGFILEPSSTLNYDMSHIIRAKEIQIEKSRPASSCDQNESPNTEMRSVMTFYEDGRQKDEDH